MDIKELVGRVSNQAAFVDMNNTAANSIQEFQEIVQLALQAERDGYLDGVFMHAVDLNVFDKLYILGATDKGLELLSEP